MEHSLVMVIYVSLPEGIQIVFVSPDFTTQNGAESGVTGGEQLPEGQWNLYFNEGFI